MVTDHQGVLICGELVEGKISTVTKELLTVGKSLCLDLNQELNLWLMGQNIPEQTNEAVSLGADKVFLTEGLSFNESLPEHFVVQIASVCKQIIPSLVVFGHTDMGRELAPRLAAKLKTTVCLDCVGITVDPETQALLQTKPVYGGNAIAVWTSGEYYPQIVTMRPRIATPVEMDTSKKSEVVSLPPQIDESSIRVKLLKTKKQEATGIKLEEAKIIVTGGGGIGGKEGLVLIQQLAKVLKGATGATRVPCDEEWMPKSLEIGQTGHIVTPDLYIAIGVSGAPQHLAGCSGAKYIVAINKDAEAHIFKEANYGIVGDFREVLPSFIEKCKVLLES